METNIDSRIITGVIGLDALLFGGVPPHNQILIAGEAGTGKTLLTFEILYRNVKQDIPCTYITLEEGKLSVMENVKSAFTEFDDVDDIVKSKKLIMHEQLIFSGFQSREGFEAFIAGLNKIIASNNSKVVVLDSLTPLRIIFDDDKDFSRSVNLMISNFRNLGVTTFVTMETTTQALTEIQGLYGTFMFDGIIRLSTITMGNSIQYLINVVKMRRSNHSNTGMPYEITPKGFNVFK